MGYITGSKGDILAHTEEAGSVIVVPVNARGEIGTNISAQWSVRHPKLFRRYQQMGQAGDLEVGGVYPGAQALDKSLKRFVLYLLAVTQESSLAPSSPQIVADCLTNCVLMLTMEPSILVTQPKTLYMPALGCGAGGLKWIDVRSHFKTILSESPLDVVIFSV